MNAPNAAKIEEFRSAGVRSLFASHGLTANARNISRFLENVQSGKIISVASAMKRRSQAAPFSVDGIIRAADLPELRKRVAGMSVAKPTPSHNRRNVSARTENPATPKLSGALIAAQARERRLRLAEAECR